MKFESNSSNEIFFVDGAQEALDNHKKEILASASAHFIEIFNVNAEVDVYISKISVLHKLAGANAKAWHMAPVYTRNNHLVCVFVDPEGSLEEMVISLAHEFIHAWQVTRGDFKGRIWKGEDCEMFPYQLQPWEIEAHKAMAKVAQYYFDDRIPSQEELNEIKKETNNDFEKVKSAIKGASFSNKAKKIAKIAGLVGLGAILGG
mgnify:CR=1 FL=1|tara:strand:- start:1466 stop:2077 length:612 start_codon:yes stop_codon:yes gene_type:complete